MKNLLLMFILFILSFISNINAQNKEFNDYYFNDYIVHYSLGKFIGSDKVIIYDEKKQLGNEDLMYISSDSSVKKLLQIVHIIPSVENYLLLSDYIINANLALISFATSNRKKYITYTLKRKNPQDIWSIVSISNGSMN
ncbi:hypothetical protein ABEG63_13810 [Chryseobacterium sp. C39-AII1]|uniref:hypothetical protein n=1 Tax=Chryseobacterium sp. C39-AII1 TaxID=3080332 RepID=UPI00320A1201